MILHKVAKQFQETLLEVTVLCSRVSLDSKTTTTTTEMTKLLGFNHNDEKLQKFLLAQ